VKYHFNDDQGIDFLTQEEADRIAGIDADYHRRDLFEAIKRGDYPSWTLKDADHALKEAETYRFNPFDLTKVWPHGDYPLREVGRLTLNRNPTDLPHRDRAGGVRTEQPRAGIGVSPDKMLLARLFSYSDAHRARFEGLTTSRSRSTAEGPGAQLQQGRCDAGPDVSDPVTHRTRRAARRLTASAIPR